MNARRDRPLTVEPMLPSGGAVHRIIGRANALRLPEQEPLCACYRTRSYACRASSAKAPESFARRAPTGAQETGGLEGSF